MYIELSQIYVFFHDRLYSEKFTDLGVKALTEAMKVNRTLQEVQ